MNDEPRVEFKVPTEDGLEVVLKLDKQGMTYRGKFIEDAGEAHDVFVDVMNQIKQSSTPVDMLTVFIFGFGIGYAIAYFGFAG